MFLLLLLLLALTEVSLSNSKVSFLLSIKIVPLQFLLGMVSLLLTLDSPPTVLS
jgi:heme A synthase